jgi:hypothetical protein
MEPTTAAWVTRAGLVFDFLAFWFAAPEILGEDKLRALEKYIESWSWKILRASATPLLRYDHARTRWMRPEALAAAERLERKDLRPEDWLLRPIWLRWLLVVLFAVPGIIAFRWGVAALSVLFEPGKYEIQEIEDIVGIYCGGPVVLAVGGLLMMVSVLALQVAASLTLPPLLVRLADDEHFRRRSLVLGGTLFTLGFLLQLTGTF